MPKITVHGGPSDITIPVEPTQSVPERPVESLEVGDRDDYSTWTYRALQAELSSRELPAKGDRETLARRLFDDDAGDLP